MTRKGLLVCAAVAAALFAGSPVLAQPADRYDRLFVFGDSLVDAGNAQIGSLATTGVDPAPDALGYANGRFSNGNTLADWLAKGVEGAPSTASLAGGRNFSFGGAQAQEVAGDRSPSFAEQIADFKASGLTFDANSLFLVTVGGNDIRAELARLAVIPGYTPSLGGAIGAMQSGLLDLYTFGARNFIITGLPDVGQIPAVTSLGSPALSGAGRQLSFGLNSAYDQLVDGLVLQTGANFQFFDLFQEQADIYADPSAFDLPEPLNTTDACLGTAAAPRCTGYVYFDPIHPTTQLHKAVASGMAQQLSIAGIPEPATWAMMVLGVGAAGAALRRRRASSARTAAA